MPENTNRREIPFWIKTREQGYPEHETSLNKPQRTINRGGQGRTTDSWWDVYRSITRSERHKQPARSRVFDAGLDQTDHISAQ